MPTEEQLSIGTHCSSSVTRKTQPRGSRRTSPAQIQTECSEIRPHCAFLDKPASNCGDPVTGRVSEPRGIHRFRNIESIKKRREITMKGKLTRSNLAQTMPVHADPLSFTTASFRGVNQVTFGYRTKTDAAAVVLPADLEIEENPEVSVMFLSYGFSSVGPFREYIHIIHARFRGEDVGFVPHIFISNERGMLAGREREGYPKLLGEIDFDMNQSNVYGLITARLSRPAGVTLAQGIFRPSEFVGEISADKPQVVKALGLRVIGSAVPGVPLAVCEFVPSELEFFSGEICSGDGTLMFTGASQLPTVHRLPIVGDVKATAFYNSAFRLHRPTETYPFNV